MRNRLYGGVRGRKMKVGGKLLHFPPTRFMISSQITLRYHSSGCRSEGCRPEENRFQREQE